MPAIAPHHTKVTPAHSATARVHNLACDIAARGHVTYEHARAQVMLEHPELFQAHLAERKQKAGSSPIVQACERLGAGRTGKV
jgi:hypothetical protein